MGIKQIQIGKHEMTVVQFGTGDVSMVEIIEQDFDGKSLLLLQDEEKPVEQWDTPPAHIVAAQNSDDMQFAEKPVVLRFTKAKSVLQLITSLQELHDKMSSSGCNRVMLPKGLSTILVADLPEGVLLAGCSDDNVYYYLNELSRSMEDYPRSVSAEKIEITWEQKERIENHGSGCTDWIITGEGSNGKMYSALGNYQGDELIEIFEIEEV